MDTALVIARLIIGLGIFAHGTQKLFGWFGGYGIKGTGDFMETLGFRPGAAFAVLSGLGESGGGVLTLLGLLNPIGPALIVMVMITAIGSVHIKKGFFTSDGGWELNSMYIAVALLIALIGPGAYSIDAALGITFLAGAQIAWIALGAAVVIGLLNLAMRRSKAA
ncbi:MAG TPA: DoxX family protein [Candidatus Eremiobacteraceae bacterium]|nr:DoxX family protein [Candidatus Eremiobacteraceae bacterium]